VRKDTRQPGRKTVAENATVFAGGMDHVLATAEPSSGSGIREQDALTSCVGTSPKPSERPETFDRMLRASPRTRRREKRVDIRGCARNGVVDAQGVGVGQG